MPPEIEVVVSKESRRKPTVTEYNIGCALVARQLPTAASSLATNSFLGGLTLNRYAGLLDSKLPDDFILLPKEAPPPDALMDMLNACSSEPRLTT